MKGWKTWVAAIGSITGGLALILNTIAGDDWTMESLAKGYAMIMVGLGLIGIGHKVEKNA